MRQASRYDTYIGGFRKDDLEVAFGTTAFAECTDSGSVRAVSLPGFYLEEGTLVRVNFINELTDNTTLNIENTGNIQLSPLLSGFTGTVSLVYARDDSGNYIWIPTDGFIVDPGIMIQKCNHQPAILELNLGILEFWNLEGGMEKQIYPGESSNESSSSILGQGVLGQLVLGGSGSEEPSVPGDSVVGGFKLD